MLEHLFSDSVKKIQGRFILQSLDLDYDLNDFDDDCGLIETCINESYKSNDEDVEDLGDIIQFTNMILDKIIPNGKFTDDHINKILLVRKKAKKMSNQKTRDARNGRDFWNSDEAIQQFIELCNYVWHPSVTKIKSLYDTHRKIDLENV